MFMTMSEAVGGEKESMIDIKQSYSVKVKSRQLAEQGQLGFHTIESLTYGNFHKCFIDILMSLSPKFVARSPSSTIKFMIFANINATTSPCTMLPIVIKVTMQSYISSRT